MKIPSVPAGSYNIRIGSGLLGPLWSELEKRFAKFNKFIVTDSNLVSAGLLKKLIQDKKVPAYIIDPPGENSKHINTVVSIVETMEKASFGRDTAIIALGGGTVGDIAGFAASIFKRGVIVIHIPTTTVSQADSAIGGKTGVDSSVSKNAFGTFWQPAAVYIDVDTLQTLADREFRAGLAESVKHALIADEGYFAFLETNLDSILARKPDTLIKVAQYNCTLKAGVVEVDPTEKNQRRMLNYGHTIGHAAEQASGFRLLHGEAVAIGIIGAGLIEQELGLADAPRLQRIRNIFEKLGLNVKLPADLDEKRLIELIKMDKKAINKWPKFVLIDKIGKILCENEQYAIEVKQEIVEKILTKLKT